MLYECWTGENPHRRATPAATARAIGDRVRALRRVRPDLPRELTETIDACLQPRPARRPALEELGESIEDSLELLADAPSGYGHPHAARLAVAATAVVLGVWLAAGHGVGLP
jgi:hypothetical protein